MDFLEQILKKSSCSLKLCVPIQRTNTTRTSEGTGWKGREVMGARNHGKDMVRWRFRSNLMFVKSVA